MRGLIFDKDGTLFDFNATWGRWAGGLIDEIAAGDTELRQSLAAALDYDLTSGRFCPGSIVIAHTPEEIAARVLPLIGKHDLSSLVTLMNVRAAEAPQVEAAPLVPLLSSLRRLGHGLCVVTNDAEAPARSHLGRAGAAELFDAIIGSDSGHGAKPDARPLLAAADAMGRAAADCVMIGDSLHDLRAGRAAGMATVGVLTGPAGEAELSPQADVMLASIAALPAWLERTESDRIGRTRT